jgi:hypothetical protein
VTWLVFGAVGGVIEARAVRRHSGTLSEALALTFRVDTRTGRLVFTTALGVGAVVLQRHITRWTFPS